MTKKEGKRSKHDWPEVWKSIGVITIVSIFSVALFGLLYWALKLNTFQFELRVALGIIWIIATELLLSRFINIVQDDFPQHAAHFALFVALTSGMLGAGDYAQRSISPYHECDSIVKENLGDAEFIHSSLLTEVDTSMLGYYVFPTVQQHYQRATVHHYIESLEYPEERPCSRSFLQVAQQEGASLVQSSDRGLFFVRHQLCEGISYSYHYNPGN